MHAGAIALVIIDDGRCLRFDEMCVRGGNKARGEGFANTDAEDLWNHGSLLTVLVKKAHGNLLRNEAEMQQRRT